MNESLLDGYIMKIYQIPNDSDLKPTGLVCVVDVIRAFTTAAYAFHRGAEKIILVSTAEEAFALRKEGKGHFIMGEEGGYKIEGFDFGNSPVEVDSANLKGKTLIQRTSNGTQGVIQNRQAKKIIVGSFPTAQATIDYIKNSGEEEVTFVITNDFRSNEDAMFANYIADKLFGNDIDPAHYLNVVKNSRYAQKIYNAEKYNLNPKDMDYVCHLDAFDFAMEVIMQDGLPVLFPHHLVSQINR